MEKMYCDKEREHSVSAQRAKEGILGSDELGKISRIFHVLSDAGRLKILLALMNGELCVYHLAEVCGGSVSGVSHQLRIMRDNGIVKAKRFGKNVEYSITDAHVREIIELATAHLHCGEV